jgi:hypothetical protein
MVFHPLTSSYTAIRGYHWAIRNRSPSRPMRSAPFSGTAKLQSTSSATVPPGASGAGSSTRISVSRIRCRSSRSPDATRRMS